MDGIIISNHGGRQLDTTPATIDILREVAPIAKGRIPLALDGGVYRGSDIFKAIALGASFVFGGRIAIWGLAVRPFITSPYTEKPYCLFLIKCRILDLTFPD